MAIPSTSNLTPLFVTRRPAWEQSVTIELAVGGDISTSRAGLEQRQQKASRSRIRIDYRAYLNAIEEQDRRLRAAAEIASPLVVPMWTEQGVSASTIVADTLLIDRAVSNDFFAVGDWVFFDSPTQGSQFRLIAAHGLSSDQELVLAADGGAIAFNPLTPIYPCRRCVRSQGTAEFDFASAATQMERLSYETL